MHAGFGDQIEKLLHLSDRKARRGACPPEAGRHATPRCRNRNGMTVSGGVCACRKAVDLRLMGRFSDSHAVGSPCAPGPVSGTATEGPSPSRSGPQRAWNTFAANPHGHALPQAHPRENRVAAGEQVAAARGLVWIGTAAGETFFTHFDQRADREEPRLRVVAHADCGKLRLLE